MKNYLDRLSIGKKKTGGGGSKSLTLILFLLLGLFGMSQTAWAWNGITVKGDFNNVTWNNTNAMNGDGKKTFYCYGQNGNEFKLYVNNNGYRSMNNYEFTCGGTGTFTYENNSNMKYKDNAGIICIQTDQETGNHDATPYCWITRPTIYLKHAGDNWQQHDMTDNNDGTYTYVGNYGGGCNVGPKNSSSPVLKWISSPTTIGSPSNRDKCQFVYNASDYLGAGAENTNTGSLTITRYEKVTYNINGGSGASAPSAQEQLYNQSITLASQPSGLAKTGYNFTGWNTADNGTGTHYNAGATFDIKSDLTLYAEWTPITYTVAFNANGGTGTAPTSLSGTYDVNLTALPANPFTKTGYEFAGWNTNEAGTGTTYAAGATPKNLSSTQGATVTLYAKWVENTFAVTVVAGTGCASAGTTATMGQVTGGAITATAATGYNTFNTWTITSGSGSFAAQTTASTTFYPTAASTIMASFKPKNITFTYDKKGGTSSYNTTSKDYDAELTTLNSGHIPSKNGYNFQGYYTLDGSSTGEWGSQLINPSGQWQVVSGYTEQIDSKIYNKKSSSCTIYAKWELATYNYTFVQNGGSGATDGTYTINSETITLPIASEMTKTGHNFAGWFTNSGLTEGPVTEIASGSYGNKTFYAKWTAKTYTIRAHSNYGADNIVEFTATYGTTLGTQDNFPHTRTGYLLRNYYLVNSATENLTITNQEASSWATSRTASGTPAPYNVDWTDGSKKWAYDGNGPQGNGPIDIYANWAAKKYTITLDNQGGTGSTSKSVTFDAVPSIITKPTNGDNIFAGYYTSTEWTTQVINDQGNFIANVPEYTGAGGAWQRDFTGTLTLYAKWDEPSTQKVHFGITNGTATTDQRGTISAKFNDGTKDVNIESGVTEVPSGKVVTITWDNSTPKGQYYTGNQAYTANNWYDKANIADNATIVKSGTGKTYTATVGSSDINAYVNAVDVLYDVTVNQATGGTASAVTAKAGPNVACQVGAELNNGYSFGGWTLTDASNSKFINATTGATDNPTQIAAKAAATITPSYNLIQYSITYHNVTDATHDNPTNFYVTTPTFTLSDASKTGYTFQGWYSDAEFQHVVTEIAQGTYANQVLYAKWAYTDYTITMVVDPVGKGSIVPASKTDAHIGVPFTVTANPAQGYHFGSWESSKTGDGKDHISFIYQGAGSASAPKRTLSIGDNTQETPEGNATLVYATNATITAHFIANSYKVVFHANGGTGDDVEQNFTYDTPQNLTANGFIKTGYHFLGWATTAEGAVAYTNSQEVNNLTATQDGTFDLYAKWEADTYTNGVLSTTDGTAGSYTVTFDATSIVTTAPVRAGYQVVGYYKEAGFTNQIANADGTLLANTDYTTAESKWNQTSAPTLYTQWEPAPMTINLNVNVGDGEVLGTDYTQGTASVTVTYLSNNYDPNPIIKPTREGYEFNGYYTAASAGSQIIDNEGHFVTHDVTDWILNTNWQRNTTETLYAQWTAVPSKITFINNGADLEPGPSVLYATYNTRSGWNDDITISKAGASFGGYWTGENGTGSQLVGSDGKWIPGVSGYTGTWGGTTAVWKHKGDVTLYAKWTTTGKVVYLKNTMNWGTAYVYFYSGSYWDATNGSGAGKHSGTTFQNSYQMTYNAKNGLFYYVASNSATNTYVAFTRENQGDGGMSGGNYGNFYETEAIYCYNNFQFDKVVVVEKEKNKTYNKTKYYADKDNYAPEYQNLADAQGTGVYIPGTWSTPTEWETKGFEFAWDGTAKKCTLNLAASTTYTFKIYTQGNAYGYNTAITESTAAAGVEFHQSHGNCSLTTKAAGNYIFEWKTDNYLRITYPVSHYVTWGMGTVNGSATAPTTDPVVASPKGLVQHGSDVTFTAYTEKPGYTWRGWYNVDTYPGSDQGKLSSGSNLAFTGTINDTYYAYAIYTENIVPVTISSEDEVKGTVAPASVTAGPATASASIAATPATGYKFDSWTLPQSGAVTIASGSATTTPITINTTAASQEITATFSERYALDGSGQDDQLHGMPGWDAHTTLFTVDGTTATATVTLEAQTAYKFKLYDKATSNRLALTATTTYTDGVEADAVWGTQVGSTQDKTGVFTSYFAGTYTFTIDLNTMKVKIDFQHKTIPGIEAGTEAVALDANKLMGTGEEATPYWIWAVNKTADAKIKVDMKKQTPDGAVLNYKFGEEDAKPATLVAEQTYFLIDLNDYEIATEAKNKDLLVYYSVDGIDSLSTVGKSYARAGVYYKYVSDPVVSFYLENTNKDVVTEAPVSTTLKMKPTVTGNVAEGNNFTYFYKLHSADGWTNLEVATADSTFTTPADHGLYDYKAVWTDNNQEFVAETSYEIYVPYSIAIKTKLGDEAATVKETITMATNGTKATASVDVPEVYGYSYGQSTNYYTTTNVSVDGTPGSSSPITLTNATADGDITFLYTKRICQITPSCNAQIGTISPSEVQTGLDMFTSRQFTYTPAAGQSFVKWNLVNAKCATNYNERSNPVVILPTSEEATISPEALEKYVNITLKVVGNGKIKVGGNTVSSGSKENVGTFTTKEITHEAYYGYRFTEWTWSQGSIDTLLTIENITNGMRLTGKGKVKNVVLTATFVEDCSTGWTLGGSWDGWSYNNQFTKHGGETSKSIGYCKINMTVGTTYEFKIRHGSSNFGCGDGNNYMNDSYHFGWTFSTSGNNVKFYCNTAGTHVFVLDYSDSNNPKVTILYPDQWIPDNCTIYFNNYHNQNNWSNPKFRLGVPGGMAEAYNMTLVPGTANLYKYTFVNGWYNYNKFHICDNYGWTGYKDHDGDTQYGIFNIGQGDYKIKHSTFHYTSINPDEQGDSKKFYEYVIQPTSYAHDGDYSVKYYNTANFKSLDASRFTVNYTAPEAAQGELSVVQWNNADGSNVSSVASGSKVDQSRWITITATPKTGYRLVSVAVTTPTGTETKNEVSTWKYAVQQNITNIVATFTPCNTYKFYVKNHADWIKDGKDVWIHYWNSGSTKTNWTFPGRTANAMDDSKTWYEVEINTNFFDVAGWKLNQGNADRQTVNYTASPWLPSEMNGRFYEIILDKTVNPNQWKLQEVTSDIPTFYRVKTTMTDGTIYYSNIVGNTDDYMSFYASPDVTSVVLENSTGIGWESSADLKSSFSSANVYIAKAQDANTLNDIAEYTGKYYVRTDGATGGWEDYKNPKNNNAMTYFTPRAGETFSYYWVANLGKGSKCNVKAKVANDYNACLAQEIINDKNTDVYGDIQSATYGSNVRFSYEPSTNTFGRAILAGAASNTFLNLTGDNMYADQQCQAADALNEANYKSNPKLTVFGDLSDWVYEKNVYVKLPDNTTTADVTVTSVYNGQMETLVNDRTVMETGTEAGLYKIRVVYDFKRNRVIAAWSPSSQQIQNTIIVNSDIMFLQNEKGDVSQITLKTDETQVRSLSYVVYVLEIEKTEPFKEVQYRISLPFDCKISDIYGIDGYMEKWGIQRYDGKKRAEIGWFAETKSFWTWMSLNDTLKAGEGYSVSIDKSQLTWNTVEQEVTRTVCDNNGLNCQDITTSETRASLRLYFPSMNPGFDLKKSLASDIVTYPAYTCTITSPEDRRAKDSDWRFMGSNAYNNIKTNTVQGDDGKELASAYLYVLDEEKGAYVETSGENYIYHSFKAHMLQFHGTINWAQYTHSVPETSVAARKKAAEETKIAKMRLDLVENGEKQAHTFVELNENATYGFDQKMDLTFMSSTKVPQIYTFSEDVPYGANVLPFEDQIIPVSISALHNGEYTLAINGADNVMVYLIDYLEKSETLLNTDTYTVDLNKGTLNDRFALRIEARKMPTNVESTSGNNNQGVIKYIENEQLYILRDGVIYNATGAIVE